jgi:predicted metal-dependent hydrolase
MTPQSVERARFREEVLQLADRVEVTVREIRIRPMTRKWASASTSGRLTFSTDLLSESQRRRREVVVHELVHLKVGNHGKLFKSLVRAHLGETDDIFGTET